MTSISGLIITFNESKNIETCISSLKAVCDDIVVVDSGSTDGTCRLASAMGAKVIVQDPFLGDGPQRSFGLSSCKHRWVLNLDADETLENDFVDFIRTTELDSLNADVIETRRHNLLGGRFTPFAGQYPDYVRRLFNKDKVDFKPVKVHSSIESDYCLKKAIHISHNSYKDYADLFNKSKYSAQIANEFALSKKNLYPWQPFFHGFWAFIRHYFIQAGFLAGLDGLTISIAKSLSSYLKYAQAIEIRRKNNMRSKPHPAS